jgi:hypothetical protein
MRQLGHRMKGVGNSAGFAQVSECKHVETARGRRSRAAESTIVRYTSSSKVQITRE